ncbi:hypothetical protein [Streptomyces sp. NBC_00158]
MVKSAALAYGPKGIRINAPLPGTTDTDSDDAAFPDSLWPADPRPSEVQP